MTDSADIEIEALPELLREVAKAAGLTAALRLARAFGGGRKYIPHSLPPGHELIEAAGAAAAVYLSATYAGETLIIPLGPEADAAAKRRAIRERLEARTSHQAIARELNCHIRTVDREASRLRGGGDPDQLSLLD